MFTRKPFVTYTLIGIQIILFIMMEFMGSSESSATLLLFGAKFNPLIAAGEYWRLITPMFLHIGIVHLRSKSTRLNSSH